MISPTQRQHNATVQRAFRMHPVQLSSLLSLALSLQVLGCGGDADEPTAKDAMIALDVSAADVPATGCAGDADCAKGQHCQAKKCVDCVTNQHCTSAQQCLSGKCIAKGCQDGAKSCVDLATARVCSAGEWAQTTCDAKETCADGACTPVICEPNKTQCTADRKAAQVCTARGVSWDKTLCQIDEACVGGSCVKLKCKPGKKTCGKDGAVLTCNPDGQDHTSQACKSSEACDPGYGTPGAQAFCKAQVCQPDTSFCAEKKAYKCASSGLEAVELDNCNKNDSLGKPMACKLGACVSVKCEPGALTCLGWTTIGKCKSDGSGYTSTDCGSKSVCEGSQCKTKICAPNEKFCDGTTAKLCDTVGVNESVIADCKSTGTQCVKGACVKAVCTDGQKNCSADFTAIELCVKGAWVPTPCAKGQACTASACKPKICEPGTKSCKNGAPVTCDVSGTAETVGNSCGSKAVCVKGACLTKDCPATTTQCKNATTQLVCNANSVGGVEKACPAKTACKNGTCIKAVCKPSDAWCEGSVGKTCATDGTKLLSSVDCAKMGQVCKEGGCIEPGCGDGQCQKTKGETCTSCPKDCGACPFNGCTARTKAGCDKCTCEACVCQLDPSCCSNAWSGFCANLCKTACNGTCP